MALGRLPCGLTQLILSTLATAKKAYWNEDGGYAYFMFCRLHLPALQGLRHLACHGLQAFSLTAQQIGIAQHVCTAARALPHLVGLHLVRMLGTEH